MLTLEQERLEAIGDQLRAKITSKFTASTFLAGFALTVLVGQVSTLWQTQTLPPFFAFSVGVVFCAFSLFVYAIIKFDELTMPKRFFQRMTQEGIVSPVDPFKWGLLDEDDLNTLFERMKFFWNHLTLPATILTAIAVLAMLIPRSPFLIFVVTRDEIIWWTFGSAVAGIVIAAGYCWRAVSQADARFNRLIVVD